jgi:Helicase associated domain/Helicase conserved C-terminal domain
LTLLQQTLDEWSRHNNWGKDFTYLCVCSDPTVAARDANDPVRLDRTDLEFRVDTNPEEVRRFIEKDVPAVKVVFSTYHSSSVVSEGVRGLAPFDVAIFDEAHKTTGSQGDLFAHSLKDENIRIRKRLFFTATARHYDIRHRDKEGDFRIASMDDEAIYGPRAYTLTFASAARQNIICNYKVVISVVDGQEINEFALKHGITLVEGDLIGARWVANQIAVERAVEKTGAKRAITFHSRVSSAKVFSSDGTRGVRQYLPEFSVFHLNGEQKSSERKQIIRSFRDASEALITNARCLTEGIDVPAVDMWVVRQRSRRDRLFEERRRRLDEVGFIWDPHEAAWEEGFRHLLLFKERESHCRVPRSHEERGFPLGKWISKQRANRDKLSEGRRQRLDELAFIWDAHGSGWEQGFHYLKLFKEREGHSCVPYNHKESDFALGRWVSTQRSKKRTMIEERRKRLDELGFVWNSSRTSLAAKIESSADPA